MSDGELPGTSAPAGWRSRARQWVRRAGVLLHFGLLADRGLVLAFFAVVAIWQVGALGRVYAAKLIVDGVLAADARGVALAAVAYGVVAFIVNQCARTHLSVSFRMAEKTGQVVDRELMALIGGAPGLRHLEDPRYQDEVALVRSERDLLARTTHAVVQNFRFWFQLLGACALLVRLHPLLLLLPLFGVASFFTSRKAQEWQVKAEEATAARRRLRGHLFGIATTATAGKELRVFDTAGAIIARHEALSAEIEAEINRAAWKASLLGAVGSLGFAAGYLTAVGLVLARAVGGAASPGDVVLAVSLAAQMNDTVGSIVGMANFLRSALRAATRYLWLADYAGSARPSRSAAVVPVVPVVPAVPAVLPRLRRGITLAAVSFRYPGTDAPVLEDVSLELPAGGVAALVGENGAGKTTLVKLLCRFYEPTSGRILVDGTDLRDLDVGAWRRRLSTGFQDFARFEFTLRESVGVGDLARRDDVPALESAMARAGAEEMAATLPAGWETQLGKAWPGGVDLSGGQWQKLALARALMRDEPLLVIFDEPTAALDAPIEHALFSRIADAARHGATAGTVTLIVSHRFSTVRMADLIVVIDQGRVREAGSHDELMRRGDLYTELYTLQAQAYR